jgi:hypothetical protein
MLGRPFKNAAKKAELILIANQKIKIIDYR